MAIVDCLGNDAAEDLIRLADGGWSLSRCFERGDPCPYLIGGNATKGSVPEERQDQVPDVGLVSRLR